MRQRRQLLPTLTLLVGAGLLIAGAYGEVPVWLGTAGVVAVVLGGVWTLSRSGVERRDLATPSYGTVDASNAFGDVPNGHHHHGAGHDSGFDAGAVFGSDSGGGGFFDGGGSGGFAGGGGGGDGGGGG